jgi:tetratricopeptide (TPR) repeat protein
MMSSAQLQDATCGLEKFSKTVISEPIFFLIGAGVSFPYPSVLPRAHEMLRMVLNAAAPLEASPSELDAIAGTQPELYYQALIEFVGQRAASMWSIILNPDQYHDQLSRLSLGPDIGHLAVTLLAWMWNLPIVTTNYDIRLEQAARQLGLSPMVCHPRPRQGYRTVIRGAREIAIWKVRGSVDSPDSLETTLYNITHLDEHLRRQLKALFETHRCCLMGYSGRDFDILPEIAGFNLPGHGYWLDVSFNAQHRIHLLSDRFIAVESSSTSFALSLRSLAGGRTKYDTVFQRFQEAANASELASPKEKQKLEEEARARIAEIAGARLTFFFETILPTSSPKRLLIHALTLATIGETQIALTYLDRFLSVNSDSSLACRALVIKAYCFNELSRYRESEEVARAAILTAQHSRLRAERGIALAARDNALYLQQVPPLRIWDNRYWWRWKLWKTIIKMVCDCPVMRLSFSTKLSEKGDPSHLRARWAYLGHLIRITSIAQAACIAVTKSRFLKPVIHKTLVHWWHRLETGCKRAGYAVGLSNTAKYLERCTQKGARRQIPSSRLFEMLVARIERALSDYHDADQHIVRGEPKEGIGKVRAGITKAREVKAYATMLRGYIMLARNGVNLTPAEIMEAREAIGAIQSEPVEEIAEQLWAYLQDPAKVPQWNRAIWKHRLRKKGRGTQE